MVTHISSLIDNRRFSSISKFISRHRFRIAAICIALALIVYFCPIPMERLVSAIPSDGGILIVYSQQTTNGSTETERQLRLSAPSEQEALGEILQRYSLVRAPWQNGGVIGTSFSHMMISVSGGAQEKSDSWSILIDHTFDDPSSGGPVTKISVDGKSYDVGFFGTQNQDFYRDLSSFVERFS